MTIDSHQHFWRYDPQRHAWIDDSMAAIQRDFLPQNLEPILKSNGIDACIAVQADQTVEETEFLLGLAREHDFIQAVVGWVDLKDPELESVLEKWAGEQKLKGFRHIVQGEPDPAFMLDPAFQQGLSTLQRHGYVYDLLIFPHQFDQVLETVRRHPDMTFVLDHLAKPYIKAQDFDEWAKSIHRLAQYPNVACKISGMVTEANWHSWTYQDLLPVMDTVLEAFGPERLLYGSDWPVCLVAADYERVVSVVRRFVEHLTVSEQTAIMGRNAQMWYRI